MFSSLWVLCQNVSYEYVSDCTYNARYIYHRTYLDSITFYDICTVGLDTSVVDTFKVLNQKWQYKHKGEYIDYISKEAFYKGDIIRKLNSRQVYYPKEEKNIDGKSILVYRVETLRELNACLIDQLIYFDLDFGIIKRICGGQCNAEDLKIIR